MIEAASAGTDQEQIDLARTTYGFLFFGTPHRGLETVDLKCMVEENRCQSRNDLLDDIKCGSRILEQQLSRFTYWVGDRKVVSFIEMQQRDSNRYGFSPFQMYLADGVQQPDES